jgi:hypothetical protein
MCLNAALRDRSQHRARGQNDFGNTELDAERAGGTVSRPARVPERGDVPPSTVAQRMGLSVADLELHRPALEARNFPHPDPTTGRYCIEAVDRWRLRRYPNLFPDLTTTPIAVHASNVVDDRLRAMEG